jgi:hypothetical protein
MQWRYGVKEYLEGGIDGSVFEVIEIHEGEDRGWGGACVMGDTLQELIEVTEMVTRDLKNLTQPDVTTTLYEWWWTDTPDVKYSTGMREDDEETERVCEGL